MNAINQFLFSVSGIPDSRLTSGSAMSLSRHRLQRRRWRCAPSTTVLRPRELLSHAGAVRSQNPGNDRKPPNLSLPSGRDNRCPTTRRSCQAAVMRTSTNPIANRSGASAPSLSPRARTHVRVRARRGGVRPLGRSPGPSTPRTSETIRAATLTFCTAQSICPPIEAFCSVIEVPETGRFRLRLGCLSGLPKSRGGSFPATRAAIAAARHWPI